jgi:hypothetical protein
MTKYWFKPKTYGYGMVPISWEGWLVVAIFVGILYISAYINYIVPFSANMTELLSFLLDVVTYTALFIVLFKDKTNGTLEWRWGKKKWF